MRTIAASVLFSEAEAKRTRSVLDVGCGSGYMVKWLRDSFGSIDCFGIDNSRNAAALWNVNSIDTSAMADVTRLPFPDGAFDLVSCFDVLYQFTPEELPAAIREIARVIRPRAFFFIREPAYDWLRGAHDRAVGTRHRFDRSELKHLLNEAGFIVRRATYANTLLFLPAILHRLLIVRGSRSDLRPVNEWLNGLLERVLKLEARVAKRINFPFGLSVIALAQKR